MDIQEFIANVAEQFDDLQVELTPATEFRKVEGWTSLVALLVITMVDDEYGIVLPPEEMRKTNTIQVLFVLVVSKQ